MTVPAGASAARAVATFGDASDPIAQLLASEQRAVTAATNRLGGLRDWHSSLPPVPAPAPSRVRTLQKQQLQQSRQLQHHPATFALHLNIELVAAAAFHDCDGVFVAWEVVLPVDQGWSHMPSHLLGQLQDAPALEVSGNAVANVEDPWVTLPDRSASPQDDGWGEGDEYADDAESDGRPGAPLLAQQQREGVRRRRQRQAQQQQSGWTPSPAPAPVPRARSLVIPSLSGVTQIARFTDRPWTFGRSGSRSGHHDSSGGAVMGHAGTPSSHVYPGLRSSHHTPAAAAATLPQQRFSSAAAAVCCSTVSGLHDAAGLSAAADAAAAAGDSFGNGASGGGGSDYFRSRDDFATVHEVTGGDGAGARESLCAKLCCLVERGAPFLPRVPVAHLCCPLPPLHLVMDARVAATAGRGISAEPPQLYLAAFSRDAWGRTRCEGYGFADLPTSAGSVDVVVRTWKPVGDHAAQERDFFLGGGGRLIDATTAGIPAALVGAGMLRGEEATPGGANLTPATAPTSDTGMSAAPVHSAGGASIPYDASASVAASIKRATQSVGINRYGWKSEGSGELAVRVHAMRENAPPVLPVASESEQLAAAAARTRTVNSIIADARALHERDRMNATSVLAGGSMSGPQYPF
jgi:hypothetical protein